MSEIKRYELANDTEVIVAGWEVLPCGTVLVSGTDFDRLQQERDALARRVQEWQPIETAPPTRGNGPHVLAYVPRFGLRSLMVEAWVNDAQPGAPWVAENGGQIEPTHWMPLPAPPVTGGPR